MIEFRMPSLGADMEDGTLTAWRVNVGDFVKSGDIIAEIDTQKGLIEIEFFEEGIVDQLLLKVGEKVKVGTVIATFQNESALEKSVKKAEPTLSVISKASEESPIQEKKDARIRISPLAKIIAHENKINLEEIKGTGEGGIITKEDVEKLIKTGDTEKESVKKTSTESIRMAVAAAMSKSNREIPQYYLTTTIDMDKAIHWLSETNAKRAIQDRILTVVLFIKAVALALKKVPELNAIWENGLILKNEIHIGFVVSLRSGGLMIPAVHDADKKNLSEIMSSLNDLIERARMHKLKSSELTDSTISITAIGDGGAEQVFGIIYPPQVAIIGFGSITEKPFAENGMLDVRSTVNVTLTGDHRATDGHTGSRFLNELKNLLQNPENL